MTSSRSKAARVPLLDPEASKRAAETASVPAQLAELNIFRVLLQRPATAKAMSDLLLSLLFGGDLPDRHRELLIMRIGWVTGADYEWTQHWAIAQERFGLRAEELLAVREWRASSCFDPSDRAVLAATDETLETGTISEATWAMCERALGNVNSCIELVAAIGTWHLVSQFTRGLAIPLEDGVGSWPPDGREPPAAL